MLEAICIDNDGVLVNTEVLYYQANLELFSSLDIPFSPQHFSEVVLDSSKGIGSLLAQQNFSEHQLAEFRSKRDKRHWELIESSPLLFPGVYEGLITLKKHFKLAMVTSSHRELLDHIHQKTDVLPLFDYCVCGDDCFESKPSPEPYLRALSRLNVEPSKSIAIEDSMRGFQSASGAGLRCIVIPQEFSEHHPFSELAFAVKGSFTEAVECILELHAK